MYEALKLRVYERWEREGKEYPFGTLVTYLLNDKVRFVTYLLTLVTYLLNDKVYGSLRESHIHIYNTSV